MKILPMKRLMLAPCCLLAAGVAEAKKVEAALRDAFTARIAELEKTP